MSVFLVRYHNFEVKMWREQKSDKALPQARASDYYKIEHFEFPHDSQLKTPGGIHDKMKW